jgi:hypothetical protein
LNISKRDKRAIFLGGAAALLVIFYFLVLSPWQEHYGEVKSELAEAREQLGELTGGSGLVSRRMALLSVVPEVSLPGPAAERKPMFISSVNEQLKKNGLVVGSIKYVNFSSSDRLGAYRKVFLQCTGSGEYGKMIDFLAGVPGNEMVCAVEKLNFRMGSKDRKQVDYTIVLSTLCK